MESTPLYLAPRYWGGWLIIGVLKLLAPLNMNSQVKLGRFLGSIFYYLVPRRRKITEVNIALCFPELNPLQQKKMVKECIKENAIGLVQTGKAWFGDSESVRPTVEAVGLENLKKAKAMGRGVIIAGAHYSSLDMGAMLGSFYTDFTGIYRANNNPLIDKYMRESRYKYGNIVAKDDIRAIAKALRNGDCIWYPPDQDFGPRVSVFAPFFGIEAATVTITSKLSKLGRNSPVIVVSFHRKTDNTGYILRINSPIENYPSGDDVEDARKLNQQIENEIRREPTQYMWVHRRFKTRPEGESGFYD